MFTQTNEPMTRKAVDLVNACVESCIDGHKGYDAAAIDARDPAVKVLLQAYSAERSEFARALETLVERHGGTPKHHGTARGSAHRGFMEFRVELEGSTDALLLGECESSEAAALAVYDRTLAKASAAGIPADIRAVIIEQRAAIQRAGDELTRRDLSSRSGAPPAAGSRVRAVRGGAKSL